jgi:histone acetyltransferase (RNA polymerase elongator complex component)
MKATSLPVFYPFLRRKHLSIWPVFIPFAGCPHRCSFCSQNAQTGTPPRPLSKVLEQLDFELAEALEKGRGPYELAFFGGTFTALPDQWPERFLHLAAKYREKGFISCVRCSTRPDAVTAENLARLKGLGLDMVELGIQSFDDAALEASGRGYAGNSARAACKLVREAGLRLGVQLMPGLPGDVPGLFRRDVETAVALAPDCARLYPCVVMDGTPLAETWRNGDYSPWGLEHAKDELADALLAFGQAEIPVIRMGLAPEAEMNASLLAGPWHPAFGQSVRALALFRYLAPEIRGDHVIVAPSYLQGEIFGHANELKRRYAALGLGFRSIRFEDRDDFLFERGNLAVDPGAKIR